MADQSPVIVAGLIGEESVEVGMRTLTHLGGSGCYAALGASLFVPTQLIGVAAGCCLADLRAISSERAIDISQIQVCPGRGFHYTLCYENDYHTLRSFNANWGMSPLFDYALNAPAVSKNVFLAADDPARQLRFVRRYPDLVYGVGINEHFIGDFQSEYKQLIANAKLVVLNKREWELLRLDNADPGTMIILTDGSRPITVCYGRESFEQDVCFERDIVDPTGCGDVFGGAFFALWASADFDRDRLHEFILRAMQASHLALMSTGALDLMQLQAESTDAER